VSGKPALRILPFAARFGYSGKADIAGPDLKILKSGRLLYSRRIQFREFEN